MSKFVSVNMQIYKERGNVVNIVIIDDGVNNRYLNNIKLKWDLEVNYKLEVKKRKIGEERHFSHGTICAAIILKYAPNATISSIKILDDRTETGHKEHLLSALKWCLDKHIKIINLSVGTIQYFDFEEIRILISKLYHSGCIIVAAYNNRNIYTMPASLECTIGVQHNENVLGYNIREDRYERYIETSAKHELIINNTINFLTEPFNSFAAPYVTAIVHNIMQREKVSSLVNIWNKLYDNTKKTFCHFPDFIDTAIIINISLDEYEDLFYFQVKNQYYLCDIEQITHIDELEHIVILANGTEKIDWLIKKLESIQEKIQNIFCCFKYNDISSLRDYKVFNRIWHEQYYWDKYDQAVSDINIDIPLVYIYGTGRHLIEILLGLKRIFINEGYSIRIIGQFMRAYLYGFEFANKKNRGIIIQNVYQRYKCDLIICGIDSDNFDSNNADITFVIQNNKIIMIENSEYIEIGKESVLAIYEKIIKRFI